MKPSPSLWLSLVLAALGVEELKALPAIDITRASAVIAPAPSPLRKGSHVAPDGSTFDFDAETFLRNGKPWLPVVGEAHYSRIARKDWMNVLRKMKAGGVEIVSTYVFWNHHEEVEGTFDWSDRRDLRAFLDLCKTEGLFVILRLGPWSHGEARYGGHPDWLVGKKGIKLRSSDPDYLAATKRFYEETGTQAKGLLFKDGGPVVAVQIENEYEWKTDETAAYMLELKRLALEAGFDVPFTTHFSPNGKPGQIEMMGMRGGYCDAPWSAKTVRLPRPNVYRFAPVKFDSLVGADLFGERKSDAEPRPFYPTGMAEHGGGFQVTWHRRPLLFPGDVAAQALVNIGSGCNLIGYYMFHGGWNPKGRLTSLQESRATKYPNDVPLVSYDFQAPLGESTEENPHFRELRLMHLALRDFGDRIAPMKPTFPPWKAGDLRWSIRSRGDAGLVFFNNHVRYVSNGEFRDVRFEWTNAGKMNSFPDKGVTIPPDAFGFWPFGWDLDGARLEWATAQPLCVLRNPEGNTWVFFETEGVKADLRFDPASLKSERQDGNLRRLTSVSGGRFDVLVLTRKQALTTSKIAANGRESLLFTDADVIPEGNSVRLQTFDGNPPRFEFHSKDRWKSQGSPVAAPKDQIVAAEPKASDSMDDFAASNRQPGPRYKMKWAPVPGSTTWDLEVPNALRESSFDFTVKIEYSGDTAALYLDGDLVADDFQKGDGMRFRLKRVLADNRLGKLTLQIVPFTAAADLFLEDPNTKSEGLRAGIRSVRTIPIFETDLSPLSPPETKESR